MANTYEPFITSVPARDGEGRISVTVEFRKDGAPTVTQVYRIDNFSARWLKDTCAAKCNALNNVEDLTAVTSGKLDTTVTPEAVDTAAVAWSQDFMLATQVKTLVDLGVIPANNPKYVALLARLKTNFLPKYINLV